MEIRAPKRQYLMEFPLSRAPEVLFDRQLWEIFVSYFETSESAYERIGFPPDLTGYHHEDYAARCSISKERWQEIEEACAVGRELIRSLQRKFLSEELTATGVPRGYSHPTRQPIPPSEWLKLWPNFAGNWAMSTKGSYDDVQLSLRPLDETSELQERCEFFLLKRKREGESLRKVLIEDTTEHFGGPVPVRIFNAAYRKIFERRRGRPRTKK
jgi:hypothetical protein